MNNKLTFNGTEYELIEIWSGADYVNVGIPNISFKGKLFYGKAIVDKRWPVDGPPEQKSEEQKDWEVLSFIYQHYIYCPRENGGYKKDIRYAIEPEEPSENDWLGSVPNGAAIYSVKRLIDGEVFSVGDRLWSNAPGVTVEITGFDIAKERAPHVIVRTKEHGYWSLLNIKKAEEKKEWKVLSFIENSHIYNADGAGKYVTNGVSGNSTIWEAFHYGNIPPTAFITSVKRLTDGEVFCIGDAFTANAGCDLTIKSFEINDRNKSFVMVWSVEYGYWPLSDIKKKEKKPIFKTHDGVEYFEGQEDNQVFLIKADWSKYSDKIKGAVGNPKGRLYFSTKVAAKNFILKNKPTLSHNEVIMFLDAIKMEIPAQHMGSFIKMIQSKL